MSTIASRYISQIIIFIIFHQGIISNNFQICRLTNDCHFVSYKENKERCHLKNEDAPAGAVVDLNYISAEKCCDDESCLIRVR